MPIPRATYRVQLRPEFTFDDAAGLTGYLASLGVTHLYASPYLQAAEGSTHGYDVVDPTRVSEELGGEAGHRRLTEGLERAGLGQVLDIVPNHMAVTRGNAWWWDVLRNGPASRFAHVFDVDWNPPEPKLRNQVLLPILGDHYGRELEAGRIRLAHEGGAFTLRYANHEVPVAPRSLSRLMDDAAAGPGLSRETSEELAFLGRALARDPGPADVEVIDRRLATLVADAPGVAAALDAAVAAMNVDADALDALIGAQHYRLSFWRTAGQELDYRRFFDIHTLAGLRTEDPRVFDAIHDRILAWVGEGVLDGLRVDHPDGLRRPAEYFQRLRDAAPDVWIVVEKILMPGEALRSWPVDGTTGYDFLNDLTGVFLDPAGEDPLTELWQRVSGDDRPFRDVALEARREILRGPLSAEVSRLANVFVQVCEARRRYRDFTRRELADALTEVAASFPVYRSYVSEDGGADAADREVVERAVAGARTRRPDIDEELLDLLRAVMLGLVPGDEARALRMRLQQLTGAVAAKGEEDTAFYRYLRFPALNEVGGDPGRWGVAPGAFHERCRVMAESWPASMTALSTHDTKRSEDVRARMLVLAEIPDRWTAAVGRWREGNARHWPAEVEPDPAMEYLLYHTAFAAWPIEAGRLVAYMEKASREAKLRTSWTDPDAPYDDALRRFVAAVRQDPAFIEDMETLVKGLGGAGRVVSLAQKLVQLTAPGVPDVYQGTEVWDLSLVDPDNRRPVEYDRIAAMLDELSSPDIDIRAPGFEASGRSKLWTVRQALRLRAERPASFVGGSYQPLEVRGEAADHAFGFLRGGDVAVVVPRLVVGLARSGGWKDAVALVPPGPWENVLTGELLDVDPEGVRMARLLARLPVALLKRIHAIAGAAG